MHAWERNCLGPREPKITARRLQSKLFWGDFDQVLWTCPKYLSCQITRSFASPQKGYTSPVQLPTSRTPATTVSWLEHRSAFSLTSNQVNMSNFPLFRDPWAKREAWRKSPVFSNRIMFSNLFPGFGIAVVAFTAYVIADNIYLRIKSSDSHHWPGILSICAFLFDCFQVILRRVAQLLSVRIRPLPVVVWI